MSEWRHDPLRDRCVRIAAKRAERPNDYATRQPSRACPFCAGAEAETPEEVDRVTGADGRWLSRVVPNLYPVVDGVDGAHEVIIESPRHVCRFVDLTDEEAAAAVTAWGRRIDRYGGHEQFGYRLLFKNEGPLAGASLEHLHSQFMALPEAPAAVAAMWRRLADAPGSQSVTQVCELGGWRVVSPPAPRSPLETWLLPPADTAPAELVDGAAAASLASVLRSVLGAIDPPAFNLVAQLPPAGVPAAMANRWWVEIVPRSASVAGFELATGLWINPVAPEEAAARLRERLGGG